MDIVERAETYLNELTELEHKKVLANQAFVAEANVLLEELSERVAVFNATLRRRAHELGSTLRIYGVAGIHVHAPEGGGDGPSAVSL